MPFSVHEKIAEIKKELEMRRQVYPKSIGNGHLTVNQARRQTAIMEEILRDYEAQEAAGAGEQVKLL